MLHPNILVAKSSIDELGLFAGQRIRRGERIWQLDPNAESLTLTEAKRLPRRMGKQIYQCGIDTYVILTDGSEYMNHSCNPNTWANGDITFDARVDIAAGEEVTCDYGTFLTDSRWNGMVCHCNSRNCRARITSRDCLNVDFQTAYVGHLPSWVTRFINEHTLSPSGMNRVEVR
ncbi:MAG TPA: SET domain-containing protein [Candidatus Bathyarchaeia archaeon]|nr:SET domain-containing protein [Candidatus Bathyarchaeia archaeon]